MKQSELERHNLFELNVVRLAQLAYKGLNRGMKPDEFAVICIDVDDPTWTDEVEVLMPGHDWQQYRDHGEKPIARGNVSAEFCRYIGRIVPGISKELLKDVSRDRIQVIVLGSGGASLYCIQPIVEQ